VIVTSFLFFLVGWRSPTSSSFRWPSDFSQATRLTGVQMMTDIDKYLSFVLTMFIAFGLTFEDAVVVVVLVRLGIVASTAQGAGRYIVVGAFVIGAIFTPPT